MKNNYRPEIRFSIFNGGWTPRNLNSVADRLKSYSLSRDVETEENTGFKYIHYGDIHTKVAEIVDESSSLPNIKSGNYELLQKGDLVLADASEDYQGIAKPAVIFENISYKLVSGLHTIALRPKNIDSLFLYYLFNSPTFKRYGYKAGTGMKVFGISATNLMKFESLFPHLEEQIKIGDFLRKMDKTIILQEQELDTLKQTKKGFMQKMFPKEGESVPELRFLGFNSIWKKQKLKELGEIKTGSTPSTTDSENYSADGILWITPTDISKRITTLSAKRLSEKGQLKARLVEPGTILVTSIASIGKNTMVTEFASFNQQINSLTPDKENDSYFLLTQSDFWSRQMKNNAASGTMQIVNKSDFSNIIVRVPQLEEQVKIGNFFKQLDEVIALQEQELDALKQAKKAFLQKMFV